MQKKVGTIAMCETMAPSKHATADADAAAAAPTITVAATATLIIF